MKRGGEAAAKRPGQKRELSAVNAEMRRMRRTNLKIIAEQRGGVTSLAKRLGYATSSYVSQLCGGQRPIREETARHIEKVLGLPSKSMDTRQDLPRKQTIDDSLVTHAWVAVSSELEKRKLKKPVSVGTRKKLVDFVEEEAIVSGRGEVDEAFVRKLIDLIKD